jgi:hypothetical protein
MRAGSEATAPRKHDPRKWRPLGFGHAKTKTLAHEPVECGGIRAKRCSFGRPGTPAGGVASLGAVLAVAGFDASTGVPASDGRRFDSSTGFACQHRIAFRYDGRRSECSLGTVPGSKAPVAWQRALCGGCDRWPGPACSSCRVLAGARQAARRGALCRERISGARHGALRNSSRGTH